MQLPSIFSRMMPRLGDVEQGQSNPQVRKQSIISIGRREWSGEPPVSDRDPQVQDTLTQFRHYVGIHNDPDLERYRPVPNLGIYQRIVKAERMYKQQYKWFSWLINGALGLQIVFAAALTALGAGDGPRSAVTAFGAMNTILAGVLTFLKGSGLPNRMKYYQNELTKVREYIEQREREFSRGDVDVDLRAEVAAIEEMYETVKRDIEVNTPDAYVSMTRDTRQPPPPLNRYAAGIHREVDDRFHDMDEKYRDTRKGLESRVSQARLGLEARLSSTKQGFNERAQEARSDLDSRLSSTRHDVESRLSQERLGMENRISSARRGVDSQIQESQGRVDDHINSARLATAAQVEDTRHGFESRLEEVRSGVVTQVEDSRHGVESRLKEVQAQVQEQEDKIMGMAEKVAEKVLSVTQQHRHDHEKS